MNVLTKECGRLRGDAAHRRFVELSDFLTETSELWGTRPFLTDRLCWEERHPDVSAWLSRLSNDDVDRVETDATELDTLAEAATPGTLLSWRDRAAELSRVDGLASDGEVRSALVSRPEHRYRVPGRKWGQVVAFASTVLERERGESGPLVDWCAGKGHLGRTLGALSGRSVLLLERRGELESQALERAATLGARCRFETVDVLDARVARFLREGQTVCGLHACGILTDALLRHSVDAGVGRLFVATCCYHHLDGTKVYQPSSEAGRMAVARGLSLDYMALRLASADELVAPPARRQGRRREMVWRLGLDALVRAELGGDTYRVQGPLPARLFRLPFEEFCNRVADGLLWSLPARWSAEEWQRVGHERARLIRARGVVRSLFRRALEVWIALDRVLYLEDRGWGASLGSFCERRVTPRNLVITAEPR